MAPHGHVRGELAVGAVDGRHRYLVVAPDGRLAYGQGLELFGIGERVAVAAGGGCGAAICRHVGLLDFRVASRQRERCGYDAGRDSETIFLFTTYPFVKSEQAGGRGRPAGRRMRLGRRASRFRLSRIIPVRKSFVRLSSKVHGARLRRRLRRLTGRWAAGLQGAGHRARMDGLACAKSARRDETAASTGSRGRDRSPWHGFRAESSSRGLVNRRFSKQLARGRRKQAIGCDLVPVPIGHGIAERKRSWQGTRPSVLPGRCKRPHALCMAFRLPAAARASRPCVLRSGDPQARRSSAPPRLSCIPLGRSAPAAAGPRPVRTLPGPRPPDSRPRMGARRPPA